MRFGIFEVDARTGERRKAGVKIRLQDQPFEILLMLLGRPGEVVTREEIQAQLWPSGTVVEFEHSIGTQDSVPQSSLHDLDLTGGKKQYRSTIGRPEVVWTQLLRHDSLGGMGVVSKK